MTHEEAIVKGSRRHSWGAVGGPRAPVRGLGLRKLNSESVLEDTPAVRGMINKVAYLVLVL